MTCRNCQTDNPETARFCMACGHSLADEKLEGEKTPPEGATSLEEMVQDGYRLLADGRQEEALFVAKACLAQAPDDPSALALKGMVLETLDDLPGAIACFERIVELNPSSTLDRIKLEQLQRRLYDTPELYEPRESKLPAILAAIGATLVVAALGAILALTKAPTQQHIAQNTPEVSTFQTVPQNSAPPQPQSQNAQPQAQQGAPEAPSSSMRRPSFSVPNYSSSTAPLIITPDNLNGALPAVGSSDSAPAQPTPETRPSQPNHHPEDDNVIQPKAETQKTGIIRITPHQEKGESLGVSAGESENIYRIALEKMKAGDYRGAIADFQKSLDGSRQPALTHQFIGRCYRNLGDFENAKTHFRRALQMFENSKAPGAQAGADACRRELAAIGG